MIGLLLVKSELTLALKNIAVDLLKILHNPIRRSFCILLLLEIEMDTLAQITERPRKSGALRPYLPQSELKGSNQFPLLLISQRHLALLQEAFELIEVIAKVDEIILR